MQAMGEGRTWQVERVPTGVPNLDRVIDGGLTRGGTTMIVGGPGTGKTVMAEQMAFHWAAEGKRVLWLMTLGEMNEKFLTHLSEMSFFDRRQVGATLELVNLTRFLREGMDAQLNVIRETLHASSFSFVVIDGFQSLRSFMESEREVRLFLSELGAELALLGITLLITTDADPLSYRETSELTMADCVIALDRQIVEGQEKRQLQVLKLRGRPAIGGPHSFRIDRDGAYVYSRLEDIYAPEETPYEPVRQEFGLPGLDYLLSGGLLGGSTALLMGSPGAGKTLLAQHFLAEGLRERQPCLHLSFFQMQECILQQADAFGLPFRDSQAESLLRIIAHEPGQCDPDACAEEIVRDVEARGVRRLVIDGIEPILQILDRDQRGLPYLMALTMYLRSRKVTTVITHTLPQLLGAPSVLPQSTSVQVASDLILLHFAELEGRLRRFVSVVKMRHSAHSNVIAELLFHDGRINIVTEPVHAEAEVMGATTCPPVERPGEGGGYYPYRVPR